MGINSRLSVGIHILALLEINKQGVNTSEYLASSINTNPTVVRKITGLLRNAGLVEVHPGVAGAKPAKEISEITLFDVYRAVNPDHEKELFSMHDSPNPMCPVGKNIQGSVEPHFKNAQRALEKELEKVTISDVVKNIIDKENARK
ncbi:Rrf2 family transcriptional regulator [Cohnella silvisoli]|uniref:Rrf2 family transcriptional regulator n=1 Tax=Cohnella silvisoli TaxID=2873699 RepID=A0ABV1KML6_9BACL|nr:Rrf2 family transcriptional regulator [Cohnella silvisoli]MCD9020356.1 Rrf2 family transcriptional regulator [Cohnella silvisoli]